VLKVLLRLNGNGSTVKKSAAIQTKNMTPVTGEEIDSALYAINLYLLGSDQWRMIRPGQADWILVAGCFDLSSSYGKLIFAFWDEDSAQSWRVMSYQLKSTCLRLQVARQLGQVREIFEIKPIDAKDEEISLLPGKERRRQFQGAICALIESAFPGARIDRATTYRDDWRQLSGVYTRVIIEWRGRKVVGIGVNSGETQDCVDAVLGAGIVWFDRASAGLGDRLLNKLLLFVPNEKATLIAERLTAINYRAEIVLYEYDDEIKNLTEVRPFDQGDLALTLLRNYAWFDQATTPRDTGANQIIALAPDIIKVRQKSEYDSLSIHGLEFARCHTGKWSRIEFGLGEDREILTVSKWPKLETLIDEIVQIRTVDSPDRQHPFYTLQSENWLATMIQRDITSLDLDLDDRFVYSQVPAYKGEDRGYVDLLAVTRNGQLVVIELKVSEDPELPFQGLDYWLRVEWHRMNGEFSRRGYFPGLALNNEPSRLYLVAPLFRFHKTFPLLAKSISPRVPVWRIGVNDSWRAGVQVLRRERAGDLE